MTSQLSKRRSLVGAGVATVALASTVVASTVVASSAGAAPASASRTTTSRFQAAAGWLQTQFVTNRSHLPAPTGTHFESAYGGTHYANYGENDDVIFALAAAKAGAHKAAVASAYLKRHVKAYADVTGSHGGPYDGSLGKLAVGALIEGGHGTDFGGYDLMGTLKQDECAADATACTPGSAANIYSSISESFVLIAEGRAGGKYAPSAAARSYFASLQCSSGGFTDGVTACGSGAADLDSTSYAIMAMQAMGTSGTERSRAVAWLEGQQKKAGYWKSQGIANVDSTGLATSALQGVGAKYHSARAWLRTQQIGPGPAAGALRYGGSFDATTTSATSPSVLATAQGLSGLVDGSTLAKVTAARSTAGVRYFAPTVHARHREKAGKTYSVHGGGFAAGEKVRITRGGKHVATVRVGPDGRYRSQVAIPSSARPGHVAYEVAGESSGLTADFHLQLVT